MRQAKEDWRDHKYSRSVLGFIDRHGYIVTGVIFLCLFGFGIVQNTKTANNTEATLCTFTADLERRVQLSEDFLRDQDPIPGIPDSVIRNQIEGQKQTLESLSGLDCGP